MFDLPCVIFAGGKSSRMGRDKALLPFGGRPSLAQFQYDRLEPHFQSCYLSVDTADKIGFHADCIVDVPFSVRAPSVGFVSAFRALDAERIFVLSVDTPFVDTDIIRTLVLNDTPSLDAVVARSPSGPHPLCGIYHRSLLRAFERSLAAGSHRMGALLAAHRTHFVSFDNDAPFFNLNRPDEYARAVERY